MSSLLTLVTGAGGGFVLLGAAILAVLAAYLKGLRNGSKRELAEQAAAETEARDAADMIRDEVRAMPPGDAREALKRW